MLHKRGVLTYLGPKRILLCVLLFVFVGLSWYLRQQGYLNPKVIFAFIGNYPLMAPFIFIACYALALLLMIPTLPLNLGAGMLWGPFWGSLIAMAGSGLGVICAFTIARSTIGQPFATRFDNRAITWLQNELEIKGWKVVAFTRINPIFPSGPLNFIFGLTSISFATYIWSSIVFLIPLTVAFAIIGHEVSNFVIEGEVGDLVKTLLIISAVITSIVLFRVFTKLLTQIKNPELP